MSAREAEAHGLRPTAAQMHKTFVFCTEKAAALSTLLSHELGKATRETLVAHPLAPGPKAQPDFGSVIPKDLNQQPRSSKVRPNF